MLLPYERTVRGLKPPFTHPAAQKAGGEVSLMEQKTVNQSSWLHRREVQLQTNIKTQFLCWAFQPREAEESVNTKFHMFGLIRDSRTSLQIIHFPVSVWQHDIWAADWVPAYAAGFYICAFWIVGAWELHSGSAADVFCGAESALLPQVLPVSSPAPVSREGRGHSTAQTPAASNSICDKNHITWFPGDPGHAGTEACLPHPLLIRFCYWRFSFHMLLNLISCN